MAIPRRPILQLMTKTLSIESMLVPLLTRPRVAQAVKWTVYSLLIINGLIYFYHDYNAYRSAVASDAAWSEFFEAFVTSIDMFAWLALVFVFELETYILTDEAYKGWIPRLLVAVRVLCYAMIFYSAYGYTINTLDNYETTEVAGLTDLCEVTDQGRYLQLDVIEFVEITAENCADISVGPPYYQIDVDVSLIDAKSLKHVQWIGWPDISNAFAWLFIVFLIEVEVWLQTKDRFGSRALKVTRQVKSAFYGVLLINVAIWAFTGYGLYAYDSLLWIVGFWAIELNLVEWEQERLEELAEMSQAQAAGESDSTHPV
jgi:hypothetical protein